MYKSQRSRVADQHRERRTICLTEGSVRRNEVATEIRCKLGDPIDELGVRLAKVDAHENLLDLPALQQDVDAIAIIGAPLNAIRAFRGTRQEGVEGTEDTRNGLAMGPPGLGALSVGQPADGLDARELIESRSERCMGDENDIELPDSHGMSRKRRATCTI